MRVLVIDDEEDVRSMVVLSLTRIGGMEVVEAGGFGEALGRIATDPPDCILLDVMMPGTDGPAVLEILRSNPATKSIPVVFLTAKARPSDVQRLTALGAAGVVVKPFDPMTLPSELRRELERNGHRVVD